MIEETIFYYVMANSDILKLVPMHLNLHYNELEVM